MQRNTRIWLAALAALGVTAVAGQQPAIAKETTVQVVAQPVRIGTFSGAYLAGRIAESDDDLDNAIAYYKQALAFDPDNQSLQQSLMLSLIARGKFEESLPYAQKLKTVAEVERVSRLALAVESMRKKDYRAAQDWLQLALESDLDRLIVNIMAGWAKFGEGNAAAGIDHLEKLQGPDWYSIFTIYHRALIADAAGIRDKAEKLYAAALDDVGGGTAAPDTYLRSAEAYAGFLYRNNRKADALAVLDRADAFAANRLPLAVLREKINKGEKVAPLVSTPVDGSSETLLNLGTALNRGGGEPFVRLYLQLALALKPQNDTALMHLAEVSEQQENSQDAIDLYRRVPADSPFKRLADMQLGLNLADLDKKDEAITHLKKLLADQPDDMRAYLALGGVYSSKEDFRSAATLYDEAVAKLKAPQRADWNVFYQRGIAYERLKEWDKAEPSFKKALELFPDQPQVMNYLGYSWVDMNRNLEEGLGLIRKAVDLRPSDGYIVDSLGWAYYRLGRFDEAVTELERAVSLKPDDAVLNDHLGDAYWRAGRKLEATFQWNHARDLKPEPDVLATVQKKITEGMPPLEPKAAAGGVAPQPAPPAPKPEAKSPDTKSETPAPVDPAAAAPVNATPAVAPATPAAAPAAPAPTPPPSDTAAAKATPAAYVVRPGQSLWSIAAERLGSGDRYIEIINLNPHLRNPGRLLPGTELVLPGS
ncbi:MAG TPA: tetratricopeptide repeat protein [Mesorhizobium sp.]